MTTMTADLISKIERRAKRAWRRRDDGAAKPISRISNVTDTELMYRLPYSPGYYGKEKVRVVRHDDGGVEVDPKTTGLIDCKSKSDLDRLKKHGGEVRAYMLVKAGTTYQSTYVQKSEALKSREQCVADVKPGDRVYVVEVDADDLTLGYDSFTAREFEIVEELDQEKDLGFTTGLLDCRSRADLEKLKKHAGSVRAYLLRKREKRDLKLNAPFTMGATDTMTFRQKCIDDARPGDKAYVAEFDFSDIKSQDLYEGVKVMSCQLVEELDAAKDLGLTVGTILDLKTIADVEKLRKHVGPVRGYKYVTKEAESPTQAPKIKYEPGKDYEVKDANTDEKQNCAAGINIASQEWVKTSSNQTDQRWFAFEFDSSDIAAIPAGQHGKIRCFRVTCVDEVDRKFKPIKALPQSPQDDLDDLCAPPKKKKKKGGFIDKLLGREGDDEDGV